MKVICKNCGVEIEVPTINRKGQGAAYAGQIKTLGPMRTTILEILSDVGADSMHKSVPKKLIAAKVYDKGIKISGNALSGRLSELLGMGLVRMVHRQIMLHHPKGEFKFRPKKIPCWYLSEAKE
jgi:hypothetical protein